MSEKLDGSLESLAICVGLLLLSLAMVFGSLAFAVVCFAIKYTWYNRKAN